MRLHQQEGHVIFANAQTNHHIADQFVCAPVGQLQKAQGTITAGMQWPGALLHFLEVMEMQSDLQYYSDDTHYGIKSQPQITLCQDCPGHVTCAKNFSADISQNSISSNMYGLQDSTRGLFVALPYTIQCTEAAVGAMLCRAGIRARLHGTLLRGRDVHCKISDGCWPSVVLAL